MTSASYLPLRCPGWCQWWLLRLLDSFNHVPLEVRLLLRLPLSKLSGWILYSGYLVCVHDMFLAWRKDPASGLRSWSPTLFGKVILQRRPCTCVPVQELIAKVVNPTTVGNFEPKLSPRSPKTPTPTVLPVCVPTKLESVRIGPVQS